HRGGAAHLRSDRRVLPRAHRGRPRARRDRPGSADASRRDEGERVKITAIETIPVSVPLPRTFKGSYYSMTHRATLITRIHTDDGVVGESYNGDEDVTQEQIRRIIADDLAPRLIGKDPLQVEARYEDMVPATFDILGYRRIPIMAVAAVDSALWDIVGKAAGLPLATLWGGYRDNVPIIAIGGYYGQSLTELGAEMEQYRELGFGGCKVK